MLAAEPVMLVLRFLHIVSGAPWVGSAFLFVGFIGPSAAEVGPSAGLLLSAAVRKRRVSKVITWLGMITVAAGWLMWLKDLSDHGGLGEWLGSGFGLGITLGALLATATFSVGYYGVGRNVERLVDLGDGIASSGGPPRPTSRRRWRGSAPTSSASASSTSSCSCSRSPRCPPLATGRRGRLEPARVAERETRRT